MPNPTVSVVIPAFNVGAFIADAIRSVLNQSYSDIEVLIVDNMSTDDTAKIAGQFGDSRVRVVKCRKRGAAAARNVGVDLARGDFLQYLDADDILSARKIENQLNALEDYPSGTVASCAWGRFSGDPCNVEFFEEPVWKDYPIPWKWLLDSWDGGGMMQTACWLVPRFVAEEAGQWNESISVNDDGEYFSRILLKSSGVAYCPEEGVLYRSSLVDSLSRRIDGSAIESAYRTCELYEEHIESAGRSDCSRHSLRLNYLNFIYRYYPSRRDLMQRAWLNAVRLGGTDSALIGGTLFQKLARCIGFMNALRLRSLVWALGADKRILEKG